MTVQKVDAGLTHSSNRDITDKLLDLLTSKDFGGLSDGATNDTTDITNAIADIVAEYSAGVIILPVNTVYTEASIVHNTLTSILDLSKAGYIQILSNDEGATLPVTKGGLVIKTQGISGVLLSVHDSGISANPYLRLINQATGALAELHLATLNITGYTDGVETTTPSAPAANSGRVFFKDNGSGKTQMCVLFNTGAVQVLATEP